jgi:hypothetical protein
MTVLQDILSEGLTEEQARIIVQQVSQVHVERSEDRFSDRSKTLGQAKSLLEFYDLVRQAINDYDTRAGTIEQHRIKFTEEEPDASSQTETVTFSLVKREPGMFDQGPPFGGTVRNLRPMIREIQDDEEHPGYKRIITGYWYDNIVRFTCWARTNKRANYRAWWFENFMQEYSWWFTMSGVARVLYWGQKPDVTLTVNQNKWYGRPIDFYVKTERIRVFSEKTLEEILIKLAVETQ